MTLYAALYFSFRSPYSYLALPRWREIQRDYDLTIDLKQVYPLAIRQPDFFERSHPNWLGYTIRDVMRVAQHAGIPFAPPRPDPIVQNVMTRQISVDQPYIHRLVRTGQAAERRGRGFAYADEVAQLIFGGTAGWHQGEHLTDAAMRAGLDMAELDAEAERDADALDAEIAGNQAALEAAGHWGVPTLVFQDEPFFGQDRIDLALWRMEQAGLNKRV